MPGVVALSKCFASIVCSSATSSIASGWLWTRCTPKRSCSSTRSQKSSRPRSTPSSDSRPTIPTVTRFPIASCASCRPPSAACSIWSPARTHRCRAFRTGTPTCCATSENSGWCPAPISRSSRTRRSAARSPCGRHEASTPFRASSRTASRRHRRSSMQAAADDGRATFERDGYLGPVGLLDPAECRRLVDYLGRNDLPEPAVWSKGRAVHERYLFDIATQPAILDRAADLLGDDVVLWGVSAVRRKPGDVHLWHSDIESSAQTGGFVSVWIGLEHTS